MIFKKEEISGFSAHGIIEKWRLSCCINSSYAIVFIRLCLRLVKTKVEIYCFFFRGSHLVVWIGEVPNFKTPNISEHILVSFEAS